MSDPVLHYAFSPEGMGPMFVTPAEDWYAGSECQGTTDAYTGERRGSQFHRIPAWGLGDNTWSPFPPPCLIAPPTPTWVLPATTRPAHAHARFMTGQLASFHPYFPDSSPGLFDRVGQVSPGGSPSFAAPNVEAMQNTTTCTAQGSLPPSTHDAMELGRRTVCTIPPPCATSPAASAPPIRCFDHGCGGRRFSSKGNYVRHLREKSGLAKRFSCQGCGRFFTRSTARDKHGRECRALRSVDDISDGRVKERVCGPPPATRVNRFTLEGKKARRFAIGV
ncbi:hypothetical protein VUR80DRAFT_8303 [Thermomyces stellatus]